MRASLIGPRVLLRRLREVMAEPISPQDRLDKIVVLIASNMVTEVCSIYVLRSDNLLELYATEGLKREAVHLTNLCVGEGLVGTIAADAHPLNLSEAQSHPAFAYRPETGEDQFHSFLGVPILRAGRTLGVLVVQNKTQRSYNEEEVEALQTTAMVLAEMIAAGELEEIGKTGVDLDLLRPVALEGASFAEGIGLGHVVLHDPRVVVTDLIAEDSEHERTRLDEAINNLRLSVDRLLDDSKIAGSGEHRAILEAYRMFAHDRGWVRRIREALDAGLTAEAAVERVQNDTRARMMRSMDPYLRERLHDLDDLANRLLRELVGRPHGHSAGNMHRDAVIVARNMGAAELLDYQHGSVRGLILEEGAPTSHVAIVARSLGIPTVGQAENATALVEDGDAIIVDGDAGTVHLRPAADVEAAYAEKVRFRAKRQEEYQQLISQPAQTLDGAIVDLLMNAGLLVDLPNVEASGAVGIGLFRTELQFMVASRFPRMTEQRNFYAQVLDAAGSRPVTFRSIDVGGDKVLPFLRTSPEENPAMGWRAIRISLDRPSLLRTQVRALLHAAARRDLRLMFPMLTEVEEFDQARELVEAEIRHLTKFGHVVPKSLKLGAMVEVPSLVFQIDELLQRVDFISIGSNDLMQFFMAVDRGNTRVANRYDTLSVPFLRLLRQIARKADEYNVPVTLCGEIAGRPLDALALLAIGYTKLSMTPASIGPIKSMVRAVDLEDLKKTISPLIGVSDDLSDVRTELAAYAKAHRIPI
ncbi:phosphoenolpyruvate--protein phosphotransferase [Coralliovum pocilloporae]|uniref:phosphoenolpyruvate--protein phosphotransferase n=1 Tax=Coralliovum pocilloporae TaxID=3066369 RepID=UPI003306D93A